MSPHFVGGNWSEASDAALHAALKAAVGDSLGARTTKAIFEKLLGVYRASGRDARTLVLALELVVDKNFGTGRLRSEKVIRIGIEVKISVYSVIGFILIVLIVRVQYLVL